MRSLGLKAHERERTMSCAHQKTNVSLIRRHKINRRACFSKPVLPKKNITLYLVVAVSQLSPGSMCTEDEIVPSQITPFVL